MQPQVFTPPITAYYPSDLGDYEDSRRASECETMPPLSLTGLGGSTGVVYGLLARARSAQTFSQIRCRVVSVGSGVTGFRLGVYDSAGAKLAETADLVSSLAANAVLTAALGSSVTLARGAYVYLAWAATFTTSTPTLSANATATGAMTSGIQSLYTQPVCRVVTGWTPGALPASLSQVGANSAVLWWMGLT